MTNLTEKLDEVQLQLTEQHNAMITVVSELNTSLQSFAASFDAKFEFGGLLYGISQNITQTKNFAEIMKDDVYSMRNLTEAAYNNQLLLTNASVDNETWTRGILQAIGPIGALGEPDVRMHLSDLSAAILSLLTGFGTLPNPGAITLLGLTAAIKACSCDENTSIPIAQCSAPFSSIAFWETTKVDAVHSLDGIVASFPSVLPAGLEFDDDNDYSLPGSNTHLVSETWDDWNVYVETSADYYFEAGSGYQRYRANEWRGMFGSGARVWLVEKGHYLKVTLCKASDYTPPGETCFIGVETGTIPPSPDNLITASYNVCNVGGSVDFLYQTSESAQLLVYYDLEVGDTTVGGEYAVVLASGNPRHIFPNGISRIALMSTFNYSANYRISIPASLPD